MQSLLDYYYTHRDGYSEPFRLRIHRAISWLKRAEACAEDEDFRFIALWIAFNAAYARELDGGFTSSERSSFSQFLRTVCALDTDRVLEKLVWETFSGSIRVLLDNRFVFQPFWDFHNGKLSEKAWQEDFTRARQKAHRALASRDTDAVLLVVFERLYTLRNQLLHGGSTYASQANRAQLRDACAILRRVIVPVLLIMQRHHDRPTWGQPFYPFIKEG